LRIQNSKFLIIDRHKGRATIGTCESNFVLLRMYGDKCAHKVRQSNWLTTGKIQRLVNLVKNKVVAYNLTCSSPIQSKCIWFATDVHIKGYKTRTNICGY